MLVRDYMTPRPPTLRPEDTLRQAANIFHKYRIGAAPVLDGNGGIAGMLTNADIINAVIVDLSLDEPVGAVMTRNVVSVGENASLEEILEIPFDCLPVVAGDKGLVGMISRADFLKACNTELQQATDEVQALIRSAHSGIIVINAYGIVTRYNEAAARIVGMPVAKAIGRTIMEVIPNSGLRRVLETGQAERDCELMMGGRTAYSNRSPIFQGRRVVGALAIMQDVSELRTQLIDARNNVEDLLTIFENARQGIVVVDAQGVIMRVNRAYEDIFNVSREDIVGCPVTERIENTRLHIVAGTGIPEFGEIQTVGDRQVVVNRYPVFRDGKITGAVGEALFRDVSEVGYLLERLQKLERQVSRYQSELDKLSGDKNAGDHGFANIIGSSRALTKTKNLALRAAQSDNNVLLLGESGTGKELFARAIHNTSKRREMPLVTVNCAAVPAELLEAELFGYDEGAFTGARKGGKKGKFELADKGTLFLDEIGDMPLPMQAKMLRVLEDNKVDRVGGSRSIACDVRIIAATNKPLAFMVQQRTFREDLYYRLNVIRIHIPPLRDRREDIGEIIEALVPEICRAAGRPAMQFAPEAMELIRGYGWPGNVRELINLLKQLAATVDSHKTCPHHLLEIDPAFGMSGSPSAGADGERSRIGQALAISRGNKVLAAKLLGWHRSTLYEKLKKYDL